MTKNNHSRPIFFIRATLRRLAASLAALAFTFPALAELDKDDPAAELASFKLAPGFEISLFASEKDGIVKPIQMRFDTRGRLFVIGSKTYPQLQPGEVPDDKVWVLEDSNHDGKADSVTVFADGLMIPTGLEIAPMSKDEGRRSKAGEAPAPEKPSTFDPRPSTSAAIYVGEGPKLWLMTDTDGDGKADKKEVVFRGFGTGDNHQNINSFRWSPGGELMFCQGLHAHARIETARGIVGLDEAGFWRYRPRTGELDAFYGGQADPQNPWGFVWTDWGQPLLAAGNNGTYYYPLPEMIRGVQGGRRDNIWPEGRGRKTSGPDIVGTAHFPDDWQGTLIAGGYISNAVWALRVEDDGAGFRLVDREAALEGSASALPTPAGAAPRPAGIPRTDEANPAAAAPPRRTTQALVTSTHPSFRPVDVKFGPDGALYICDWYNPIIGHYQSSFRHPDRDKAHGRIWRVTAKGRPLVVPPPIAGADLAQLFENLKSPERYVRYATKLELAGRSGPEVPRGLRDWCDRLDRNDPATEHARYEALGVFEWLNWPNPILLNQALNSKLPGLRAYAVGVLGRWADSVPESPSGPENLVYLAKDKDARVRLAAVVASGNIPKPESVVAMMTAAEEPRDKSIDLALTSAAKVLAPFAEKALAAGKPEWRESFAKLAGPNAPPHRTAPPTAAPPMTVTISPAPLGKYRATPDFVASLTPEIQTKGDAKNGGVIYNKIGCAACHALGGVGGTIGPALDAIGTGHPLDFIIGATIEPQREVKEGFECYDVKTKDGATYSGYFVAGTEAERTLRDLATGKEVKLRPADIAEKTFRGSVMPANLTDALTRDELRDLIAFLAAQGKPQ